MRLCKFQIEEVEFSPGNLKTPQGENVWTAALDLAAEIAFKQAEVCLAESKTLRGLNKEWGRNAIQLFIAEQIFHAIEYSGNRTVLKILVADSLSRDAGSTQAHLIFGIPAIVSQESIAKVKNSLEWHTFQLQEWAGLINRAFIVLAISAVGCKRFIKRVFCGFWSKTTFGDPKTPALLLLQEDDLSMDRSYRGQPHWIFRGSPPPAFRSLILETGTLKRQSVNHEEFEKHNIFSVTRRGLHNQVGNHPAQRKVDSALRAIIRCGFFGDRLTAIYSAQLVRLLLNARLLAGFCVEQNVKAFMACENYLREAHAMNLIGPTLGVRTISYQYSNIPYANPGIMTSAEKMCTFSPLFHNRWRNNNLGPLEFHDIGYLFDGAFKLLRKRANRHKEQLTKEGVKFIVAYFDESVQKKHYKYSLTNRADHLQEVRALAGLVLNDHKCAVIAKSQFVRCTPSVLHHDERMLQKAISVGRFVELVHGSHRNSVFPAEAALAADIVIGHVVGATAALEAALVGTRCILLNPYYMKGPNIDIFEEADILYEDIHAALDAINGYRQGQSKFDRLGLWDDIINRFDPYRDGQSAMRLRECLEHIFWNHGAQSQRNPIN